MSIFKPICISVLGKYGVYLYYENDKLNLFINEQFPGVGNPLNQDIFLDTKNNNLEYGIRLNGNIFRYYVFSAKDTNKDLTQFNGRYFYDMDINEQIKRRIYL